MKIVGLNVLIYAVDERSAHHRTVLPYWQRLLEGEEGIGLHWIVLVGFLRITTNPRAFSAPLSADVACALVDEWLALDVVSVPLEKPAHW